MMFIDVPVALIDSLVFYDQAAVPAPEGILILLFGLAGLSVVRNRAR